MNKYRRFTKLANEYDYEIITEVPNDEEDMQQWANNTLGHIEDLMERYDVNSLFELELYLCGFNKFDINFFLNCETYSSDYLIKNIYIGWTKERIWQKRKYLQTKLKKARKQ